MSEDRNDTDSLPKETSQDSQKSGKSLIFATAAVLLIVSLFIAFVAWMNNYFGGAVVSAEVSRQLILVSVSLVIAVLLFGFIQGSTASIEFGAPGSFLLKAGGPFAAALGFYYVASTQLNPFGSAALTLRDQDGRAVALQAPLRVGFSMDGQFWMQNYAGGMQSIVFRYLPKGREMAVELASDLFYLSDFHEETGNSCKARREDNGRLFFQFTGDCESISMVLRPARESAEFGLHLVLIGVPVGLGEQSASSALNSFVDLINRRLVRDFQSRPLDIVYETHEVRGLFEGGSINVEFNSDTGGETLRACTALDLLFSRLRRELGVSDIDYRASSSEIRVFQGSSNDPSSKGEC
jgi:hypothetical protein